ncbi:MAG TPA: glycosyltransferase [Geminicoccaceae bacterium]|nr:glycosyltransferase [Geminicoccus sp.]HMU49742.1 glycosyltransferase [Geminicoccaceae bacterium]
MKLLSYILVLAALAANAPVAVWDPHSRAFFVILGLVGAWRYLWGLVHLGRALVYGHLVFPRWRRAVTRLDAARTEGTPVVDIHVPELYCIVTSYRIRAETTALVYRALLEELVRYGRPATVVASIVELADERFIKQLFARLRPPPTVRLVLVRRPGIGKRDGLATALRAVQRSRPQDDAAVIVMDGDTVITPGTLHGCLPFIRLMPRVGGMTTDEDAVVDGSRLMSSWHRLRFAQRHLLMSSMGLSRRLMTLTGRMSIFRAEIATDPGFVTMVADDALDHWRLGRIPLLTGEDKSTWLWLLEQGWDMLYVPDIRVLTVEHPPARGFLRASTQLMLRWFGNMLRASGRAIALGPRRIGLFTWWCLVDQRLSMWTPLVGPVVVTIAALSYAPALLYAYALWVMTTRLLQALALLTMRPTIGGLWPVLIYYNQVYGALLKTWVLFRLDRQRWTRQNIALRAELGPGARAMRTIGSAYVHGLALLALVTGLAFLTGGLTLPSPALLSRLF